MAKDVAGQRRRAMVAVLSGWLDETALLQELWNQHDTLRGDSVTDIIEFVDALAGRRSLDAMTTKRLYGEVFKALRLPESELPPDPWPAMQAVRPAAAGLGNRWAAAPAMPAAVMPMAPTFARAAMPAPVAAAPMWAPPVSPVSLVSPPMGAPVAVPAPAAMAPAAAAQVVQAVSAAAPPSPPAVPEPPAAPATSADAIAVFAAVMRNVVREIDRHHREALDEIRRDALMLAGKSPAAPAVADQFTKAWQRARQSDWRLTANPAELTQLTGVVYRALELAFGRVGAEHILQRGTEAAAQEPEAIEFPPRRLLAAL